MFLFSFITDVNIFFEILFIRQLRVILGITTKTYARSLTTEQQNLTNISKQKTFRPIQELKCLYYPKIDYKKTSKIKKLDFRELLDDGHKLRVQWGNSTNIPFVAWVNLEIQLEGADAALSHLPFLATSDYMERPILKFNVLKEMLQDDQQKDALKQNQCIAKSG